MKMIEVTTIIDEETGEILSSPKTKKLQQRYLVEFKKRMSFNKSFAKPNWMFNKKKVKRSWLGYLYLIEGQLEMYTNRIVDLSGSPPFKPLLKKDMQNLLDISERNMRDFMSFCIDRHIMAKGFLGEAYYYNPCLCYNGRGVVPEICVLFRDSREMQRAITEKIVAQLEEYCLIMSDLLTKSSSKLEIALKDFLEKLEEEKS